MNIKKRVKILFHPINVNRNWDRRWMPNVVQIADDLGTELEVIHWDGRAGSVPIDEPCLIRVSSQCESIHISRDKIDPTFAKWCHTHGHLPYYQDTAYDENGNAVSQEVFRDMIEKIFIEN